MHEVWYEMQRVSTHVWCVVSVFVAAATINRAEYEVARNTLWGYLNRNSIPLGGDKYEHEKTANQRRVLQSGLSWLGIESREICTCTP